MKSNADTSGEYRREKNRGVLRQQKKNRIRRRLLQSLEQGVLSLLIQVLCIWNDIDLIRSVIGLDRHIRLNKACKCNAQCPRFRNCSHPFIGQKNDVRMTSRLNLHAGMALSAGLRSAVFLLRLFTQKCSRKSKRQLHFPGALFPADEISL